MYSMSKTGALFNLGSIEETVGISGDRLTIGRCTYTLSDPNAARGMPPKHQEIFWALCSDKVKDSDLYRAYASSVLSAAKIDLRSIKSPKMQLIITNNASNVAKLNTYLVQQGNNNWLQDACELPEDTFEALMKEAIKVQELLRLLMQMKYHQAYSTLVKVTPDYLKLLLNKISETITLLPAMWYIGYRTPLERLLHLEFPRLSYLLQHGFNAGEVLKALGELGYFEDAVKILLDIPTDKLNYLLKNYYAVVALLKKLSELKHFYTAPADTSDPAKTPPQPVSRRSYPDPLAALLSIDLDKVDQLAKKHYEVSQLLDKFSKLGYVDPLKNLLDLNAATFTLFCQLHYDANTILEALHASGKSDPIAYFIKLGENAMRTVLSSSYNYSAKIRSGVDLITEFSVSHSSRHFGNPSTSTARHIQPVPTIGPQPSPFIGRVDPVKIGLIDVTIHPPAASGAPMQGSTPPKPRVGVVTTTQAISFFPSCRAAATADVTEIPKELQCPITKKIMKEPVLLSLNGLSYEKEAITAWLNEHRCTPDYQVTMAPNVAVASVLFSNLSLAATIEDYQQKNQTSARNAL